MTTHRHSQMRLPLVAALATALIAAITFAAPTAQAAPAPSTTIDVLVASINEARSDEGLRPLRLNADLAAAAQDWSEQQADAGHSSTRPDPTAGYPAGWVDAGQSVSSPDREGARGVFLRWMNSANDRANILQDDFTDIGVGWEITADGQEYVTVNFARYARPLVSPPVAPPAAHDFDGDGHVDVLAVTAAGNLRLYTGNGRGGWSATGDIGTGWTGFQLITPGDLNLDGFADLLAVAPDGRLFFYAGRERATFATRVQIGHGWQGFRDVFSPGDFDGDGNADVVGVTANGDLRLYRGTGDGRVASWTKIGHGWQIYTDVLAGGDFDGNGRPDILAKDSAGRLFAYYNRGNSAMSARVQVGNGWGDMRQVSAIGDFTGDGAGDLFAVSSSTGLAYVYAGSGKGGFAGRAQVGNGWAGFRTVI